MAGNIDPSIAVDHQPTYSTGIHSGQTPFSVQIAERGFTLRPPQPKYSSVWEVERVLAFSDIQEVRKLYL